MVIRIEAGKGRRDRYAKLSPKLLEELRAWWRRAKPKVFLFPSRMSAFDHISARQFSRVVEHILRARDHIWITRPCDICAHIESLPKGVVPGS